MIITTINAFTTASGIKITAGLALAAMVAAYLLGSIPFGLLLGFSRGVDIRKHGSGNIGATNAGRVLGMRFFWYAFLADFLKGFIPVLISDLLALRWNAPIWIPLGTALAAVLGHLFPVYLNFKGGKGVATTFGALLGVWPIFTLAALAAAFIFLCVFLARRIISLSSVCGALGLMIFVPVFGHWWPVFPAFMRTESWHKLAPLIITAWVFGLMVIVKHRGNIQRLLAGTEPRMGEKKRDQPADTGDVRKKK